MNKTQLVALAMVMSLLTGCATRQGQFANGTVYNEYDLRFDKDAGKFYLPLEWTKGQKGQFVEVGQKE